MDNNLYISQIRLGDTYDIKDTVSGYVTGDVNDLTNYTNNTNLASHYQMRLQAGTNVRLEPTSIEEEGETINVMRISSTNTTYQLATPSTNGLMSKEDKSKLNGIATNAEVNAISRINYNGVALDIINKTVDMEVPITTIQINGVTQPITNYAFNLLVGDNYSANNKIATMNDIPTVNDGILQFKRGETTLGYFSANSSESLVLTLSDVAITGDYNDLINKPTELDVNDGVLTFSANGEPMGSFTANSATDVDIDITTMLMSLPGYESGVSQVLTHDSTDQLVWVNS